MNQEGINNNCMKFYRDALNNLIINKDKEPDIRQHIAAFSMYMSFNNEAYKYNVPYLCEQHEKFIMFLDSSFEKHKRLTEVVVAIKASTVIQEYIKKNPQEVKSIKICLNDFFQSDLNKVISFYEPFSISGAVRKPQDDIITVLYKGSVRSCKLASKQEDRYSQIVEMIKEILDIYKESGGTSQDGNTKE